MTNRALRIDFPCDFPPPASPPACLPSTGIIAVSPRSSRPDNFCDCYKINRPVENLSVCLVIYFTFKFISCFGWSHSHFTIYSSWPSAPSTTHLRRVSTESQFSSFSKTTFSIVATVDHDGGATCPACEAAEGVAGPNHSEEKIGNEKDEEGRE